jgi:hypothetical protein
MALLMSFSFTVMSNNVMLNMQCHRPGQRLPPRRQTWCAANQHGSGGGRTVTAHSPRR